MRNDHSVFKENLNRVKWNEAITLSEENLNLAFKSFLDTVDRLIDKHYPKKPILKTKNRKTI